MLMTDILEKKKNNDELTESEIRFVVNGAAKGSIPDYQLSAFLMAVCINSMTEREIAQLTIAMAESGEMLDLSILGDNTVDKHSTGGVGDKTTLICAPIAAALGCRVAKMSGRGLGYTGGTIDKLESITGYNVVVSRDEFLNNTLKNGICIVGQGGDFAPADKKLYALRDVTATVDCIPLIASSIISKKLASGARNIVLDVKYGRGAFMKTPEEAERLAVEMVKIANNAGRRAVALVTNMDVPLGRAVGNSLEVQEAVNILKGKGDKRLKDLSVILAANMYSLAFDVELEKAIVEAENTIINGAALEKLRQAIITAGGNIDLIDGECDFPRPEAEAYIEATETGYIYDIDSLKIARAAMLCGAGREKKDDKIDYSAGVLLLKDLGDYVNEGDKIALVRGRAKEIKASTKLLKDAFVISKQPALKSILVYKRIKNN